MTDAVIELQRAIYQALANDADLLALLGAPSIFDRAPRRAAHPLLVFGPSSMRPIEGDADPVREHRIVVEGHSRGNGRSELSAIMDRVTTVLDDAPLDLAGHHLISLRHLQTVIRSSRDQRAFEAVASFRAITEPEAMPAG